MSIDPKEFSDMSDTPQDGYGNLNLDYRYYDKEEDEQEEIIPDEPMIFDDEFDTDWK